MAVDLAKNVFQVCALNKNDKVLFNKKLRRRELAEFMAQQKPSPVYTEACYSSHYWARRFKQMGHSPFLIPAQHVTPFVRGNKNDHNDALAIAECSKRPDLRFVPIKTERQQEIIALHRIRQRQVRARLQITNQARGLLTDFGIIFPQGHKAFKDAINDIQTQEKLALEFRHFIVSLKEEYNFVSAKIKQLDDYLARHCEAEPNCQIVRSIPGVGCLTATALIAMLDKGQGFTNASAPGVWIGLTPKQFASGDKSHMGRITKRGDRYLRSLLVQGANTAIQWAKYRDDSYSLWIKQLVARVGRSKAIIAIAHKMIRLAWILLQKQEMFRLKSSH
ncbi:IS110 family transposase [Aliikangiella coralliicola]|uniref:IS110 family transposase n=2 Tax=Aliikangiella coralliicola TaxID=2592383 RepID=A0A545TP14_9GAMM|nr:IS110 family transposase [Aliikangiella coralliicola]